MTSRGFVQWTKKFYECRLSWFIPHGRLNQDGGEVHGMDSFLALEQFATSHNVVSILMRSSAKMEASLRVAI